MKFILIFLLCLIAALGHTFLPIGTDHFLFGLPDWLFYYLVTYVVFLVFLYLFSQEQSIDHS